MSSKPEIQGRDRHLTGFPQFVISFLCLAITLASGAWALEVQQWFGILLYREQLLALVLGAALAAVLLLVPGRASQSRDRVPLHDWLLAALSIVSAGYIVVQYESISMSFSQLTPTRWVLGGIIIVLVCEATRRLLGWSLVILLTIFMGYAVLADKFGGALNAPATDPRRLISYMYLDPSGLIGMPLAVAATVILAFILFGKVLTAAGGDRFITDLALSAMGHRRGGAAKVSIVASTLFGTMSGSAVSNVALVGPISIPMMRKNGYPSQNAAAVEAVASTGGQIMPPVMGITAFLIADFLAIPFSQVALAALLPALLYYLAIFVQVDVEAAKRNLRGMPREELPKAPEVLRHGWLFMMPLLTLVYTVMFANWEPGKAGMAAAFVGISIWILRGKFSEVAFGLLPLLIAAGRTMLEIIVLTALAGLIIGALSASGLTYSFSNILLGLAGNSLLPLLVMTAVTCIVLGMGMPTAVIYTMLAVLVAPVFTSLEVAPLSAHLFLFYMGMLSMITPPVCLAVFTAASIARADFWKTSFISMRLGIAAYVMPFVFIYSPSLIMIGEWYEIVVAFVTAAIGTIFFCWALTGWIVRPLPLSMRMILGVAGLFTMLSPTEGGWILAANVIGLSVGATISVAEFIFIRRGAAANKSSAT